MKMFIILPSNLVFRYGIINLEDFVLINEESIFCVQRVLLRRFENAIIVGEWISTMSRAGINAADRLFSWDGRW